MSVSSNLFNVIISPIVTEKSVMLGEHNQYVFLVRKDSSKPQIKKAIEMLFDVKVSAVNTIVRKGKRKFFRGRPGMRQDTKRAIVTLAKGESLDVGVGG